MRYTLIFLFFFFLYCCNSSVSDSTTKSNNKLGIVYDSLKYDQIFIPDSTGYQWMFERRMIIDTLEFEKAVALATSDTFLSLAKYIRLWTTPIPRKLMVPNDTVLVSGYIFEILPSNDGKGYPTLLTQINYHNKKK